MYCKKCGAEIPEGSLFCSKCGTPVENETVATVPNAEKAGGKTEKPKKPLSQKAKIWIAIGAAVLVIAIVLIIVFTTVGGGHKSNSNSTGDGRYAEGRKAYRYSDNWSGDSTLMIDKLTITPTDDGLLAEFYLENDDQNNLAWGWATPGRVTLETYDGQSYTAAYDQSISSPLMNAGEKVAYRVLFPHAKGIPKTLTLHDLTYANLFESYGDLPISLPKVNLS